MCLLWLALHVFLLYAKYKKTLHTRWEAVEDAQGEDEQEMRHSVVLGSKTENDKEDSMFCYITKGDKLH